MRWVWLIALLGGCYHTVDVVDHRDAPLPRSDAPIDVPRGHDAPMDVPPGWDGGVRDARAWVDPDGSTMLPRICGGVTCGASEECCLLDGRCVGAGDPSCVVPSEEPDPEACASNADCAPSAYCVRSRDPATGVGWCTGGVGRCEPRATATACSGEVGTPTPYCGCDGRTYPSGCWASAAGVSVAWPFACGAAREDEERRSCEVGDPCDGRGYCDPATLECVWTGTLRACGGDASHCWPGEACCAITGACHDPSVEGSCAVPPEGTTFPCATDDDCARADGGFCDAPSCGGPGGCRAIPRSCDGTLAPVCGCDGATYQNPCEAQRAMVRVARDGAC